MNSISEAERDNHHTTPWIDGIQIIPLTSVSPQGKRLSCRYVQFRKCLSEHLTSVPPCEERQYAA